MAIDTAAKRSSALHVSTYSTPPLPGGSVAVGDRAQCCWYYRGLTFAAAVVAVVVRALYRSMGGSPTRFR